MAEDDRWKRASELVDKIRDPGPSGTHGREAFRAELDILLLEEHLKGLQRLSLSLDLAATAWAAAEQRLTRHTKALVPWTKVLAFATLAYAVFAGSALYPQLR